MALIIYIRKEKSKDTAMIKAEKFSLGSEMGGEIHHCISLSSSSLNSL